MLSDFSLIWVSWDGAVVRLSLGLWKGPNALQQDGRRTESGVSSSLQLLAWSSSGPTVLCSRGLDCFCCAAAGGWEVSATEGANVPGGICEGPSLPQRKL